MRSIDVPQADSIVSVRQAVAAVAQGCASPNAVGRQTGVTQRHVQYRLHAARVLGWLEEDHQRWVVTKAGQELLATTPGAAAERYALRNAIAGSSVLQRLAPRLLAPDGPSAREIAGAIQALTRPPLSLETARRRASALLAWRRYLLQLQLGLDDPTPSSNGRAELPAQAGQIGPTLCLASITNYGLLRDVTVSLRRFQVLVGRNGTGKSTFLDAIGLVADTLRDGVEAAVTQRCAWFPELLWRLQGDRCAVALEFMLPPDVRPSASLCLARYELVLGQHPEGRPAIVGEQLYLRPDDGAPAPAMHGKTPAGWRKVISMTEAGTAWARSERSDWKAVYTLDTGKPMLAWLPPDASRFPAALAIRSCLMAGVQRIELRPEAIARPCSPLLGAQLKNDGANLALVIETMQRRQPASFDEWIDHLREILPEVRSVQVAERPEDRHLLLRLIYQDGSELPVWRLSDGTLRVLALSLLSFVDSPGAIYLVEEPENGVHPQAIEALYQSLSSSPTNQFLVATHSPVLVGVVPPEQLLCFSLEDGATSVTPGDQHARLARWQHDISLGDLFATGVFE